MENKEVKAKYKDIMLDIETMATRPDAVIVSIGAVFFDLDDPDNLYGPEFYQCIDMNSCAEKGLQFDAGSISFWLSNKVTEQARQDLFKDATSLENALRLFSVFTKHEQAKKNVAVWGNGVGFDNTILRNAYKACNMKTPWHYRDDRDVRTLVAFGKSIGMNKNHVERDGTYHNAVDDAKHQVKYCSEIYQRMKQGW